MKGSDIMVNIKQKDGFGNKTILKLVVESEPVTRNEHKKELVIPACR